jgi:hypothetical protein
MENNFEATKEMIYDALRNAVCEVTFTKVNGEKRIMPCTLKSDIVPPMKIDQLRESKKSRDSVISVWCTDKNAWRSFKLENFISIRKLDD